MLVQKKLLPKNLLDSGFSSDSSHLGTLPDLPQRPQVYNPRSNEAVIRRAGFTDVAVKRSRNVFPLDFMVKQAAWSVGIKLDRLELPKWPLGLKLGNILTIAREG